MEYDVWNKYVFRANLSDGLTGDEVITTLHPGNNDKKIDCSKKLVHCFQ